MNVGLRRGGVTAARCENRLDVRLRLRHVAATLHDDTRRRTTTLVAAVLVAQSQQGARVPLGKPPLAQQRRAPARA